MFSGPVGAYAYKAAASSQPYDVAFIVGPSHFFGFEGVSVWPDGGFDSPLGVATVDAAAASELLQHAVAHVLPQAHGREHSIEMQLPFFRRVLPDVPIVPALMGRQRRETILALAEALAAVSRGRRALLIASTDLSHYFDARTAATLDAPGTGLRRRRTTLMRCWNSSNSTRSMSVDATSPAAAAPPLL